MPIQVSKRWIQIRIDEDDVRASLYTTADDQGKSATGVVALELPRDVVKYFRDVIKEHGEAAERDAMAALMESVRIDQGAAPPDGVNAIKLERTLGISGDVGKAKK